MRPISTAQAERLLSRPMSCVVDGSMRRRQSSISARLVAARPSHRALQPSHLLRRRRPAGCSSRKRTSALPTTTPSATAAAAAHLLRASRCRSRAPPARRVSALQPRDQRPRVVRERVALAGHAGAAHRVDEAARAPPPRAAGARRGWWARPGRRCRGPPRRATASHSSASSGGRSVTSTPSTPASARVARRAARGRSGAAG